MTIGRAERRTKAPAALTKAWTVADLLEHFGDIEHSRIRQVPAPGTATERDAIELELREDRLYELVDGVLVEKVMSFTESALTIILSRILSTFVSGRKLGVLAGEAGMMRLAPGLVRIPDISLVSRQRLRRHRIRNAAIAPLGPDLAVEVLSKSNTKKEMERKLLDYFAAGARLVWYVDPIKRTVKVFASPTQVTVLHENHILDGGDVLPGFTLRLRDLFAELDEMFEK